MGTDDLFNCVYALVLQAPKRNLHLTGWQKEAGASPLELLNPKAAPEAERKANSRALAVPDGFESDDDFSCVDPRLDRPFPAVSAAVIPLAAAAEEMLCGARDLRAGVGQYSRELAGSRFLSRRVVYKIPRLTWTVYSPPIPLRCASSFA
jgi:hypothetical protein